MGQECSSMQQTYYNVISPLLPEIMSMFKCLTPFRHSHMNQVWSEEEKEDINREIVKTKASWLLERYSSSTFLPSLILNSLQHRSSLDFPHSPQAENSSPPPSSPEVFRAEVRVPFFLSLQVLKSISHHSALHSS